MNIQSKTNAKQALNSLKMEIASELGYNYNMSNNKIESNAEQGTLKGQAENVLAGEQVGGMMSRKLVQMGEQVLLDQYNSNK